MPRYKLTVEYDGTPFSGWQRQEGRPSVQQALMVAVQRFSGEAVLVNGAGRTDAGVHATGQVAHIDLMRAWPASVVRDAINHHLKPSPIAVLCAKVVDESFDARFSAIRRRYLYRIVQRRAPLTLDYARAWRVPMRLDTILMREAAQMLLGRHDFTTFRAAACQAKSPVKTLDRLDIRSEGDKVDIYAVARSFLHSQVRSMVGALKAVGEGRRTPAQIARALAARDRGACEPVAPAFGLYLIQVDYAPSPEGKEKAFRPKRLLDPPKRLLDPM